MEMGWKRNFQFLTLGLLVVSVAEARPQCATYQTDSECHNTTICSWIDGYCQEDDEKVQMRIMERSVKHAEERCRELGWKDTDRIEVYNAEFLLAAWVLDHAPWNAYHSGLAFANNITGDKVLFDFSPDNTSSVMRMVMPEVLLPKGELNALLGQVSFGWRDQAHMEFHTDWPDHYTTFTRVGVLNGKTFFKFVEWINSYYVPTFKAFNPVEIVVPDETGKSGKTVLRSRMCHDFVTDSLWRLYEDGAKLKAESTIFRDHILMYAESAEKMTSSNEDLHKGRTILRYYRTLLLYLAKIKQQFTHARVALITVWRLGLPAIVHDEYGEYHSVKLTPPFLNYCYLPLAIPPDVYEPFGSVKLCALGMEANASNQSTPFPWGHELAVEGCLDRQNVILMLFLTAMVAAAVTYPEADKEEGKKDAQK